MTPAQVAADSGLTPPEVSMLLQGVRSPSKRHILLFARAEKLATHANYLLGHSDDPDRPMNYCLPTDGTEKESGMETVDVKDRLAWSIPEFAAMHGLSAESIYRAMRTGDGPKTFRLGRRVLVSREAAEEWRERMNSQRESA